MARHKTWRWIWALMAGLLAGTSQGASTLGMGEADARHLLERTGFGAPPAQVQAMAKLSREQAVDQLMLRQRSRLAQSPPAFDWSGPRERQGLSDEEKKALQQAQREQGMALRAWWVGEMLWAITPADALSERMALFWHNHFVSSLQKVKSPPLMLAQIQLFRTQGMGNFATLLHAVSKDPAMMLYLDGVSNRKGSPNENFAREVMELFTLGEGNYTEKDIKEAARAFTGWSVDRESGTFLWRPGAHDDGEKQVLGRTGAFDGDQVLDILLAQPATATFIVGKLWREFVSPDPDPAEVRRIAAAFRGGAYEMTAALRPLLLSKAFWAPENRGALVKSPVDLLIGTLRTLAVDVGDTKPVAGALRQLGQDLFAPPNVKGWPGGNAWINTHTLLARKQYLERLLRAEEMVMANSMRPGRQGMMEMSFDSRTWLNHFRQDPQRIASALLALTPVEAPPEGARGLGLLRALLMDPVYQLK